MSTNNNTWWTDHSCVLTMFTIMHTNFIVRAFIKVCFIPSAVHIIQEDRSSCLTNNSINIDNFCCICKLWMKEKHLVSVMQPNSKTNYLLS